MLEIVRVQQAIACAQPYPLSMGAIDAEHVITDWGSGLPDLGVRMPVCTDEVAGGFGDGKGGGSVGWPIFHTLGPGAKYSVGRRVRGFHAPVAADDRDPVVE